MSVPMMDVREMGMTVRERLMHMGMRMRFLAIPRKIMFAGGARRADAGDREEGHRVYARARGFR